MTSELDSESHSTLQENIFLACLEYVPWAQLHIKYTKSDFGNPKFWGNPQILWKSQIILGISPNFGECQKLAKCCEPALSSLPLSRLRQRRAGADAAHTRFLAEDELQGKGLRRSFLWWGLDIESVDAVTTC